MDNAARSADMTDRICAHVGCTRKHEARGYCKMHYYRLKGRGQLPLLPIMGTEERFWSKVDRRTRNECWEWKTGKKGDGYGQFYVHSIPVAAHRYSYELHYGVIPAGLEIDHLCRNRSCVNPYHLEAVTKRVNILRGVGRAALNARRKTCTAGHPFDKIQPDGRRKCSICRNAYWRDRYRRKRAAAS
jgi:hypothetical protein